MGQWRRGSGTKEIVCSNIYIASPGEKGEECLKNGRLVAENFGKNTCEMDAVKVCTLP